MLLRLSFLGSLCFKLAVPAFAVDATVLAAELSTRYAPYANWEALVDVDVLSQQSVSRYWQTPMELKHGRTHEDLPLAGLHLALDPGHIGGQWAEHEGRNFRIVESDFYVREGELVLEVAQLVRAQLVDFGAEVTLLREANLRVNPKGPIDYLPMAVEQVAVPSEHSLDALLEYGQQLRARAIRLSIVTGDIVERARLVNRKIQPDALISLHINAAAWPVVDGSDAQGMRRLVQANHVHVLIFGCMSEVELQSGRQQEQLAVKLVNGSGAVERLLGNALASALAEATDLPAARYDARNAILLDTQQPYVLARNLLLLRMVECPTVLLEPYIANSVSAYTRIQSALENRAKGRELGEDDILIEYADAVVAGVLASYGGR